MQQLNMTLSGGDLPAIGARFNIFKDISRHKYDLDHSIED